MFAEILNKPNNILAFEYLKTIKKYNYHIEPIFLKRNTQFEENSEIINNIASASKIRTLIKENKDFKNLVPSNSFNILSKYSNQNYLKNYYNLAFCSLLNFDLEKLKNTYLVSEGIENKILSSLEKSKDYEEFLINCVNKRFDKNKINRIVLNYILGIDKNIISSLYFEDFEYIKVLMAKKNILNILKPQCKLILRKNDITKKFENNKLELIENKSNLLINYILNTNLPYKDIFIKTIIK